MILVWPILLVVAALIVRNARQSAPMESGRGWRWFGAWTLAGALMTFSFLTGFSIGLFVLPAAAAALLWSARRAPRLREAAGFAEGVGAILLLVALLHRADAAGPWLAAGLAVSACALLAYGLLGPRGSY
jgi:hypothetical protein